MSAFICSNEHITALALYWGLGSDAPNKDRGEIQDTAAELHNTNVQSVMHRYPESWPELLANGGVPTITDVHFGTSFALPVKDPVHVLKLVHCLNYQSDELEDWRESKAFGLLEEITAIAVRNLPGYNKAPWDI